MENITKFLFVRHGEAEGNLKDICLGTLESSLTSVGREQARERAVVLARLSPAALFTSPMGRTQETAEIIGGHLGLTPIVDERLRERFVGADLQGRTNAEVRALLSSEYELLQKMNLDDRLGYRFLRAPDAETMREGVARLKSFMEDVSRRYTDRDQLIIAVTHAAILGPLLVSVEVIPFQGPFGADGIANAGAYAVAFHGSTRRIRGASLLGTDQ